MKKIIALSLITASLMASPATLFEISPDAYGKQVFTVGFNSYQNKTSDLNTSSNKKYGDNMGFELSNKAPLKKLGYELGEIYWRGTGGYNIGISSNSNTIKAEIGTGLSLDMNLFYLNFDISGNYTNRTSGNNSSTGTKSTQNGTGYAGSVGAGIPLGDFNFGAFYEYSGGNDYPNSLEKSHYSKTTYKIPLTYRNYRDVFTSLIYSHSIENYNELATPVNNSKDAILFCFSWLYAN